MPDWLIDFLNTDRPDRVFFRLLILAAAVGIFLAMGVYWLRHRGDR